MKKIFKNIVNELLVTKKYNFITSTPYSSLREIFENLKNVEFKEYTDNLFKINNLIISGNSITSPIPTSTLLVKKKGRYSVLDNLNLPFIEKRVFLIKDKALALDFCRKLLLLGNISLSSRNDLYRITLEDLSGFDEAWSELAQRTTRIICSYECGGDPFKIFIKEDNIIAIYGIIPACIRGDGVNSISHLIDLNNKQRKENILYKKYLLSVESFKGNLDYIPQKGELVKVNDSFEVSNGATYVDLTTELKKDFEVIAVTLKKLLCKINYMEITCFSNDFLLGTRASRFRLEVLKQNTADLSHLFSCCQTIEKTNFIFTELVGTEDPLLSSPLGIDKAEEFSNIAFNKARQHSILKEASNRLGLLYKWETPDISYITNLKTVETVIFRSGMSQNTSFAARAVSDDKYLTKKLLDQVGINTPKGFVVGIKDRDVAFSKLDIDDNHCWVVKPLSGSGGSGVSTGVKTRADFDRAWDICENLKTRTVLVEEQVVGNDYRVMVIQNKVCAVTQRIAAYIIGDGINTIDELVKIKAKERENNPFYRLKVFEINSVVKNYLEDQGLSIDYIPEMGQKVALLEAVNIGSGGESIDRTDEIHPDWIDIAVRARKAILDAHHVGLDLMAEDISLPPSKQKWSIIEVNTNPDLGLQLYPGEGIPRDIGRSLLESVFGYLEDPKKIACNIKIIGLVKGVGFRKWFKSICEDRSIIGFVQNEIEADAVEANILGPEVTLNEIFKLVRSGPKNARVDKVIINYIDANTITNNIGLEII